MTSVIKTITNSFKLILIISALSIIIGFFTHGRFTLAHIFNANFLAGAFIICIALVMMFVPASFKFDKLTDHTTFAERHLEKHDQKKKKAYEFLFVGLTIIIIAGIIQIILAVLI